MKTLFGLILFLGTISTEAALMKTTEVDEDFFRYEHRLCPLVIESISEADIILILPNSEKEYAYPVALAYCCTLQTGHNCPKKE